MSSTSLKGEWHSQLMRVMELMNAAAGPLTQAHPEELAAASLFLALVEARCSFPWSIQPSQHANAHCLAGTTCAAYAGSTVFRVGSIACSTSSGFLPAVFYTDWVGQLQRASDNAFMYLVPWARPSDSQHCRVKHLGLPFSHMLQPDSTRGNSPPSTRHLALHAKGRNSWLN